MVSTDTLKTVLYSFIGSQWAGVAHLAISHQGLVKDKDYTIKEIDLGKYIPAFSPPPPASCL